MYVRMYVCFSRMDVKKRKVFSIKEKAEILLKLETGSSNAALAKDYCVSHSTISTVWKNRDAIRKCFESENMQRKRMRSAQNSDIEQALLQWFKTQRNNNAIVTTSILQMKAEEIAQLLGKDFNCTESWIYRFRERHNIVLGTISGEACSVDKNQCSDWRVSVWPKIREGYQAKDIFNVDEAGLFYKLPPNKTLKFKGEKCCGGKQSKERITLLVGGNMDGSEKKKMLVIGKSKMPRCFKNVKSLPVDYKGNKKAWMTSEMFERILRDWDSSLKKEKRKILLLVDNCPAHPNVQNLSSIKLVFLPPNTTSVLQPMDQGVIRCLKSNYRKQLMLKIIRDADNNTQSTITLLDAIDMVASAWQSVKSTTIANSFRHAGLLPAESVCPDADFEDEDDIPLSLLQETYKNMQQVAEYIDWDEFVNVDDNVVTSEEPSLREIVENTKENDETHSDNEPDDEDEPIKIPTRTETLSAVHTLKQYLRFGGSDISESLYSSVEIIESKLLKEILVNRKQTTILNYFQSQ